MSSKKNRKAEKGKTEIQRGALGVDIFVAAVLCLFPLVVTDRYFNILQTKYYFYIGSVVVLLLALLIKGCKEFNKVETYLGNFRLREFLKTLTVMDIALLIFLSAAIISTMSSDYVYESFWGNEGRYSGLFLLLLYGIAYFCVTRFGKFKKWYLDAFLIACMLVCLFGITDYFQMDLLGFKVGMREEQKFMFTSTIGNINTYTALVGMVAAISAVLFATEKAQKRLMFYYVCMVISFFALIMGISDNAYLSLVALFGFLPLYLFKYRTGAKRYVVMIATFFTAIQCIDWINQGMGDVVLGIDSAFNIIVNYSGLLFIVLLLWTAAAAWNAWDYLKKPQQQFSTNRLRWAWLALILIIVAGICYMFFDVNVNGQTERYGALNSYLLFGDDWGTHRGYIWRNAMESYHDFSPMKKLFGFGPDTFRIILMDKTRNNIYNEVFDSAHNEYIHYLLTVGFVGMTAYIVFLGAFIVRCVRRGLDNPYIMAILFAVVCYAVQAFVNLNLPIATPIMWVLLMIGTAATLENKNTDVIRNIKNEKL